MGRCARAGGAQPGSDPSWATEMFRTTDGVLRLGMGAGWGAQRNFVKSASSIIAAHGQAVQLVIEQ